MNIRTRIGTAGWPIPAAVAERFPTTGSSLERYAARLNAVEINSSFYRWHLPRTYERWRQTVPASFRFSVKFPRIISHQLRLVRVDEPLERFLDSVVRLETTLGPLLLQLPPSFAFSRAIVAGFFERLRRLYSGQVACEPRHATWASAEAQTVMQHLEIAQVAADPPRTGRGEPGGWQGLRYYRWHGAPRTYFSSYSRDQLIPLAATLESAQHRHVWVIFDNTGAGAATANAMELAQLA